MPVSCYQTVPTMHPRPRRARSIIIQQIPFSPRSGRGQDFSVFHLWIKIQSRWVRSSKYTLVNTKNASGRSAQRSNLRLLHLDIIWPIEISLRRPMTRSIFRVYSYSGVWTSEISFAYIRVLLWVHTVSVKCYSLLSMLAGSPVGIIL